MRQGSQGREQSKKEGLEIAGSCAMILILNIGNTAANCSFRLKIFSYLLDHLNITFPSFTYCYFILPLLEKKVS